MTESAIELILSTPQLCLLCAMMRLHQFVGCQNHQEHAYCITPLWKYEHNLDTKEAKSVIVIRART